MLKAVVSSCDSKKNVRGVKRAENSHGRSRPSIQKSRGQSCGHQAGQRSRHILDPLHQREASTEDRIQTPQKIGVDRWLEYIVRTVPDQVTGRDSLRPLVVVGSVHHGALQ